MRAYLIVTVLVLSVTACGSTPPPKQPVVRQYLNPGGLQTDPSFSIVAVPRRR